MMARRLLLCGLGALLLAGTGAAVTATRGTSPTALAGLAIGLLLGLGGSFLEILLIARALRRPGGAAFGILLWGALARLLVLVVVALLLRDGALADPFAFALSFLGGFIASLPLLALAIRRREAAKVSA